MKFQTKFPLRHSISHCIIARCYIYTTNANKNFKIISHGKFQTSAEFWLPKKIGPQMHEMHKFCSGAALLLKYILPTTESIEVWITIPISQWVEWGNNSWKILHSTYDDNDKCMVIHTSILSVSSIYLITEVEAALEQLQNIKYFAQIVASTMKKEQRYIT